MTLVSVSAGGSLQMFPHLLSESQLFSVSLVLPASRWQQFHELPVALRKLRTGCGSLSISPLSLP